ncbi:phage integrase family protein [Canicola haemoglobinophilus]|uniref:Phage integrase family protein n=1 Tax=Canicola haemoglobinophilus TaxID=733 RepID=A0AB38HCQ8_9PAST|nr:site-specific integrase [Canicola haemoglobinophilus]STO55659.1 phage integrase family protein [Canicola haemoglobinophilus]STO67985.1 phage integrase family protein [Canicola haemoglobinophilus]
MATFTKRNNSWRAIVRKKNITKSKSFRTKAQAVAWANKIELEIANNLYRDVADIPFQQVIERYLKEVTPNKRGAKKETQFLYRFLALPISQISLKDLREEDFQSWRDERLKTVSSATVLREWSVIGNILNVAIIEWKLLKITPLKAVKKPAAPKPRTRRYSQQEIDALVYKSGFDWNAPPTTATARVGAAILFAIETAMRAGEIVGLTWEHIHLNDKIAHLPKTKNGWPRDVPLSTTAIEILKRLKQISNGDSVFQLSTSILDALFRKLKKRMMLEDLHFHDTRREALTRLAEKVDVMTLAKISGSLSHNLCKYLFLR